MIYLLTGIAVFNLLGTFALAWVLLPQGNKVRDLPFNLETDQVDKYHLNIGEAEIIWPNPAKEAFDEGRVKDVGDII